MTDPLNPERWDADMIRILHLLVEIDRSWQHAIEGGVWPPRQGSNGRGTGFSDLKPVETAVLSQMQAQLRRKAKRAARLIAHARADFEEAAVELANALLRTDSQEWIRATEKRRAATQ